MKWIGFTNPVSAIYPLAITVLLFAGRTRVQPSRWFYRQDIMGSKALSLTIRMFLGIRFLKAAEAEIKFMQLTCEHVLSCTYYVKRHLL